jgi:hypothetical protein
MSDWGLADETAGFEIAIDHEAIRWLELHPNPSPLVIAYQVTRSCCGLVRDVRMRVSKAADSERQELLRIGSAEGRDVLIDARIVRAMPRRVPITALGFWARQKLALDLSGEEWGRLLYS